MRLAVPERRGRAVSTVLVATTLGAVAGPNLVRPMGDVAQALGIRELAGTFVLAPAAYALAAVVVATQLRPAPLLTARAIAAPTAQAAADQGEAPLAPVATDTALLQLGARARPRPWPAGTGRRPGAALLGLSPTRYFQLLGRLLDRPEAADAEPELVAGLRAVQNQRRRLRQSQ